ncbi:MAG: hypothetical protein QOD51_1203 [Candidatus Eremiobacteraeota bacterium]|jgi:hypothetical protein|nr:hypothetical protein [Candidatus Eremiobacteraeota bacterium]
MHVTVIRAASMPPGRPAPIEIGNDDDREPPFSDEEEKGEDEP